MDPRELLAQLGQAEELRPDEVDADMRAHIAEDGFCICVGEIPDPDGGPPAIKVGTIGRWGRGLPELAVVFKNPAAIQPAIESLGLLAADERADGYADGDLVALPEQEASDSEQLCWRVSACPEVLIEELAWLALRHYGPPGHGVLVAVPVFVPVPSTRLQ